jgi:hypothetical protein
MPATDPLETYTAAQLITRPPMGRWMHYQGSETRPGKLYDLGEDAEAKSLLIDELISWVLKCWPQIKHAAKVSSLAIEIGEKRCPRK